MLSIFTSITHFGCFDYDGQTQYRGDKKILSLNTNMFVQKLTLFVYNKNNTT